jgi:hypothetical protein
MPASLLGIFTGADAAGVTSRTTSSRTTTAGSLITICVAGWNSSTGAALSESDNKSNAYTEDFESEFASTGSSFINFALGHNLAGTRGASHTCTGTSSPANNLSVTAQEWDGIDAAPTIDVGTLNTGTSTAPSCQVAVSGGAALVVGLMIYDGNATTIAPSGDTQASEEDEGNSDQAQNVAYKVSQTGTVTISWTLGASRNWACRAVAFTEAAGGGGGSEEPQERRFGLTPGGIYAPHGWKDGVRIMRRAA